MPYSRTGFTGRFQCFCVAYISRVSKFEIRFSFGRNPFSLEVVLVHSWHFLFLHLSCLWQCVAASLYCWALLRVSPWPWRKMKGGMLQGDERRRGSNWDREGSTLQEFCWVGVSVLHDQCSPLMSTQCQIQSFSLIPPPHRFQLYFQLELHPNGKDGKKRVKKTHKWIFLYEKNTGR